MPSKETTDLLRRAELAAELAAPDEQARRQFDEAFNQLEKLTGREPGRQDASRLQDALEHLLASTNHSLIFSREPRTNGTDYTPDLLITNGPDRILVEVKESEAAGRQATEALAGVLDTFEASRAFVVVPEGENVPESASGPVTVVTPTQLAARLSSR